MSFQLDPPAVRFAMLFPGQGSQSVGMLAALAERWSVVEETFLRAGEVLGYDLWGLVQRGPAEQLHRTEYTQPALLSAGVAVWRVWRLAGGAVPAVMAGHSFGEYTALCCAEALAFEDAVALVAERGRLMQEAVPAGSGAMAAVIGLENERVDEICERAAEGDVVAPANFNAPGQVVVAGHAAAVERVIHLARQAGAKRALRLSVSVPAHCALMEPAAAQLQERLQQVSIRALRVPVIHNVDATTHATPDEIRRALVMQLHRPVRWVETIRRMVAQDVRTLVECGPGRVLTGLVKRIERATSALAVFDPGTLTPALEELDGTRQ